MLEVKVSVFGGNAADRPVVHRRDRNPQKRSQKGACASEWDDQSKVSEVATVAYDCLHHVSVSQTAGFAWLTRESKLTGRKSYGHIGLLGKVGVNFACRNYSCWHESLDMMPKTCFHRQGGTSFINTMNLLQLPCQPLLILR